MSEKVGIILAFFQGPKIPQKVKSMFDPNYLRFKKIVSALNEKKNNQH